MGCDNWDVRTVVLGFGRVKWRSGIRSVRFASWGLGSSSGSGRRRSGAFVRVGLESGGNFGLLGVVGAEECKAGSVSLCSNRGMGQDAIRVDSLM